LQNINCGIIFQNCHHMQWLALCSATCPFRSVQHSVERFCGYSWSAAIRLVRSWGSR